LDGTEDHAQRARRQRRIGGAATAGLGAAAAVISYGDGLFLVRLAHITGHVVYLYPLLPDGLIAVSTASLYESALTGAGRPRWATSGVATGALLTLAMNVAAGLARGWVAALADAAVPVVFFVALEILVGLIRRGRAVPGVPPGPAAPGTADHVCPHRALTLADVVRDAWEHARDCEADPVTQVQLAATFGLTRKQVAAMIAPAPVPPSPTAAGAGAHDAAGAGLPPAPAALNGKGGER